MGLFDSLNCRQSLPQSVAITSVAACLVRGRLCLFIYPWQASQRLGIARYATHTATEIRPPTGFAPSPNQDLPVGNNHAIQQPLNQLGYSYYVNAVKPFMSI